MAKKFLEFNFTNNGEKLKVYIGDDVVGEFDATDLLKELNQAHLSSLFHNKDAKFVIKPDDVQ